MNADRACVETTGALKLVQKPISKLKSFHHGHVGVETNKSITVNTYLYITFVDDLLEILDFFKGSWRLAPTRNR